MTVVHVSQFIEGNRLADTNFGVAGAKSIVIRFGVKAPAGNYGIGMVNGNLNSRAYAAPFTVSASQANVDTEFFFPIPGDITGTWMKDNTPAIRFYIYFIVPPSFHASSINQWFNGFLTAPNTIAAASQAGDVFDVFDVGIYADPNDTGIAPEFVAPHIEDDLQECLRYWYKLYRATGEVSGATAGFRLASTHPTPMRIIDPAAMLVGTTFRAHDGAAAPNMTAISQNLSNAQSAEFSITTGTGMTAARACNLIFDVASGENLNYIAMSARM